MKGFSMGFGLVNLNDFLSLEAIQTANIFKTDHNQDETFSSAKSAHGIFSAKLLKIDHFEGNIGFFEWLFSFDHLLKNQVNILEMWKKIVELLQFGLKYFLVKSIVRRY